MGDMPNLVADASGKATLKAVTTRVTLGAGPLSVFDADGTAVIIHANPDQGVTAESKAKGLGHTDPAAWDRVARDLTKAGFYSATPNVKAAYTADFPSGVTP